jgi:hypothetical protein
MKITAYTETLEEPQHTKRLNPKRRNYALEIFRGNLKDKVCIGMLDARAKLEVKYIVVRIPQGKAQKA